MTCAEVVAARLTRQHTGFVGLPARLFKPLLYASVLGSICIQSQAATNHSKQHNLISLFELAQQHDATYQAAASQLKADLEIKNQAFSTLLPNLSFGARIEQQKNTYDISGMSIGASRNPGTYSLVLNQPLFRPQNWESYKQSQLNEELVKLNFQQAGQDLLLRLSRAYFDLLAAQDDLENLGSQKSATAEQLAFAQRNFEVGNASITDQQEAQARFDLITAQELAAQNQLAIQKLALETIVGEPASILSRLKEDVQLSPPSPSNPENWADQALIGNIQASQARLSQLIAKVEAKKAFYGHLPTVDLTAQLVETEQQIFDSTSGRPFDLGVDSTTVGVVLNLPLFNGGGTHSQVRQQAALLEKSRNNIDIAERNAKQAAKTALLGAQTSLAQVSALETAVRSSELALQSNKTAYDVGSRINIDVLNAQQQLNSTQRDLSKAKYSSLIKLLELQAILGQLNISELNKVNSLLVNLPQTD